MKTTLYVPKRKDSDTETNSDYVPRPIVIRADGRCFSRGFGDVAVNNLERVVVNTILRGIRQFRLPILEFSGF